jgi:homoserine O-acetyltransferase
MRQDAVHVIPEFVFQCGERLAPMKVGYATQGRLNAARSNALLVQHGASGTRDFNAAHVGPGKAYDTDRYFVVTVDAIGGGESSQPADGLGPRFPDYTVLDMVRAQHDLLTRGLGLAHVVAVGGPSMGAMQSLEWGVQHPDFMDGLLLIVPASRSDRHVRAIFDALCAAIRLDPRFKDGFYTEQPREGVVLAGTIYLPWIYSSEHLNTIADEAAWTPALRAFGEAWADAWDANNLISRYRAAGRFDPSAPFGGDMAKALARVRAKTLVMPGDRDRTLPPYLAQEIHRGVRGSIYVEIPSPLGHLACCTVDEAGFEHRFVSGEIRRFLASLPQPD